MPDPFASVTQLPASVLEMWVQGLEDTAALPGQRAMLDAYLADIPFPPEARVVDIGCGTGPQARVIATHPSVSAVVGVDPSPVFVAHARKLGAALDRLTFHEADGRALPFTDGSFDVALFHTVLIHIEEPERVLHEAFRVLRPGGILSLFESDPASVSVATSDFDLLQRCLDAIAADGTIDRYRTRHLPRLTRAAGFEIITLRSYSYLETGAGFMLTGIVRGAQLLAQRGEIGAETAETMQREAERRIAAGTFFASLAHLSLIARKPG
jgi:ubiquinone/menaquinone biosynthesis C-methylase UbiE